MVPIKKEQNVHNSYKINIFKKLDSNTENEYHI